MTTAPTTPAGWYGDPEVPGNWRRWDGAAWVGTTRKPPTSGQAMFGLAYAQAYWFNANKILHVTRWTALGSVLGFVLALVVAATEPLRGYTPHVYLLVLISVLATVSGLTAIVTGIIGVTRAGTLGGRGGGIAMMVTSIPIALLNIGLALAFALASTAI